jgi:UDP-N-acetylmuramoyl-tripeptide--D-alanyl-D-alanine ligase
VGGIDGVARAKAELVEALPASGTAVLNADDGRVAAMAPRTDAAVLTFGTARHADVRVTDLVLDDLARARFTVRTPWGTHVVALGASGAHMAVNAAAAIAVAGAVGVDLEVAADALADAPLSSMRMQRLTTRSGGLVINDAYNANPTSMTAALDALAAVAAERRIAVLGGMAELADPDAAHHAVAAHARRLGIEVLAVGTDRYGIGPLTDDEVVEHVGLIGAGTAVLVKASRAFGLDRLAAALTG